MSVDDPAKTTFFRHHRLDLHQSSYILNPFYCKTHLKMRVLQVGIDWFKTTQLEKVGRKEGVGLYEKDEDMIDVVGQGYWPAGREETRKLPNKVPHLRLSMFHDLTRRWWLSCYYSHSVWCSWSVKWWRHQQVDAITSLTSFISSIKVEAFVSMSSSAPVLEKIWSVMRNEAYFADT